VIEFLQEEEAIWESYVVPTSARGERRERTIYRENEDYPIGSEQRERSKSVVYIERTGNLFDWDEEEKKTVRAV
jgi:hypothetical protein